MAPDPVPGFPDSAEPHVLVCGAGAAGMAAAIASARRGVPTLLVEARNSTGGTVAHALIHTLAGLYDSRGELLNRGLPEELIERLKADDARVAPRRMGSVHVLNVAPAVYQTVTREWLSEEPDLHVLTGARVLSLAGDQRVGQATIQTADKSHVVKLRAVVDCTGTGSLVKLVDHKAVEDDDRRAAGGLVVRLRNVPPGATAFPRGIGIVRDLRTAALRGELPAVCAHAWIDTGVEPDEVYLKLFVPMRDGWDDPEIQQEIETNARTTAAQLIKYLRRFEEFSTATVEEVGEPGVRDGGRISGEYRLTAEDVRQGKTFPDGVCRCAWPIEYWHPEDGIQLESLPDDATYEIPLRALRLRGWSNVFTAGKCLSADHLAQASARVVGTCWAMGEAVGGAAAACV